MPAPLARLSLILLLGLSGCATPPAYDNNYDSVVLKPGDSRICLGNPCEVHFLTPPGKKHWVISGQNVYPGSYPPGKSVYLGRFVSGSYSFQLEGHQGPVSHLHVAGRDDG
ncbi:MAG: hypothetical protein HQL47_11415 [Gammaproteobacteria bacterium]|nr:hypothetical protein [Gammaproteobacteria bacterium]